MLDAGYGGVVAAPFELNEFTPGYEKTPGGIEYYKWNIIEGRPAIRVADRRDEPKEVLGAEEDCLGVEPEPEEVKTTAEAPALSSERAAADAFIRDSEREAGLILEDAREEAKAIKEAALQAADAIREAARAAGERLGYEHGEAAGRIEAGAAVRSEMHTILQSRLLDLKAAVDSVEAEKELLVERAKDELRDLALAVAEKVIRVSLRSSAEIIEKMITSATERITDKQWVKISISGEDAQLLINAGREITDILSEVSDRVQVEVMSDAASGTCLIETPDQIIDLSIDTQMNSIRELLS